MLKYYLIQSFSLKNIIIFFIHFTINYSKVYKKDINTDKINF